MCIAASPPLRTSLAWASLTFFCIFLLLSFDIQDLFFKYSWNNFLHFQVELCVAAILNHPSLEERPVPGLQNHEGKPAVADPEAEGQVQSQQEGQGEGQVEVVETGRTTDPQTSIHNALVAHVRTLLTHKSSMTLSLTLTYLICRLLLCQQLFQKCKLVQKILDAWEENDKIQ